MFDAKQLLDQFLGAPVPGTNGTVKEKAADLTKLAQDNPLATGAVAAVLLGTGFGRRLTGEVLKLGGLAAIAGLGYNAYRNWKAGQSPADTAEPENGPVLVAPPADSGFSAGSPAHNADFALVLVRAMIAAARADGQIDDSERAIILDKIRLSGLGSEAESFIAGELKRPLDVEELVAQAVTEEQKVELYTASRLTINPETRSERGYLDMLAGRLGLADELVAHIEATVATANA